MSNQITLKKYLNDKTKSNRSEPVPQFSYEHLQLMSIQKLSMLRNGFLPIPVDLIIKLIEKESEERQRSKPIDNMAMHANGHGVTDTKEAPCVRTLLQS